MVNMVERVMVFGDAMYNEGVADALLASGFASVVDKARLDTDLPKDGAGQIDVFVVQGGGDPRKSDALIRTIRRTDPRARIVQISEAGWSARLASVATRRVAASVQASITREHLIAVMRLVAEGFSVL